jgi:ribosomal protein S18 acetylase RimI-like enzyme
MITKAEEADGPAINHIAASIDLFSPEEVKCVAELWREFTQKGPEASGYSFLILKEDGVVKGFACFGPRSLTQSTFDLYWIAVDPKAKRNGVGRALMEQVEKEVAGVGGRLLIAETSGQEKYAPTRAFYEGIGYCREATVRDFYAPGDDLVIYTHPLL